MLLILAHYFAAHGKTMGSEVSRSPALGLPRGTIRLLLLVGYLGLAVWLYQKNTKFDVPETKVTMYGAGGPP